MVIDSRLIYCCDCQNKGFDLRKGVFCGLTKKPPAFSDSCDDYSYNPTERDRLKKLRLESIEIKKELKWQTSLKYRYGFKNTLIITDPDSKKEIQNTGLDIPERKLIKRKFKSEILTDIFIFLIFIAIIYFISDTDKKTDIAEKFYFGALILLIIRLGYFLFLIKKGKTIFTITKQGIEHFRGEKYSWQEILFTIIKTKQIIRNDDIYFLVIHFIHQIQPIEIKMGRTIDYSELVKWIEIYSSHYELTKHNNVYTK